MKLLPSDSSSDLDKARRVAGRLSRLGPVGGVRPVEAGRVNPAVYVKLGQSVQPATATPSLLDGSTGAAPSPAQIPRPVPPPPPPATVGSQPATPPPLATPAQQRAVRPAPEPPKAAVVPQVEPSPSGTPAAKPSLAPPVTGQRPAAPEPERTAPVRTPAPAPPTIAPESPPPAVSPLRTAKPAAFAPLESASFEPGPPLESLGSSPFQPEPVLHSLESSPLQLQPPSESLFESEASLESLESLEVSPFEPEPSIELPQTVPFEPSSVLTSFHSSRLEDAPSPPAPASGLEPSGPEPDFPELSPGEPVAYDTAPAEEIAEDTLDLPADEEQVEMEPEEDETGPEVPAPVFELEPYAAAPPPLLPPPPAPQVSRPPVVAPPRILMPEADTAFAEDVTEISFETSFEDEPSSPEPDLSQVSPALSTPPMMAPSPSSEAPGDVVFEVEDLGAEEVADASVIDVTDMAEVLSEEPALPPSWDPYLEDGLFLTRSRSALLIDVDGRVVASKGDLSANAVDTVAGRLFPAIQQTPPSAPFISLRLGRFFATAVRLTHRNLVVGFVSENPIREELVPLIQKEFNEAR